MLSFTSKHFMSCVIMLYVVMFSVVPSQIPFALSVNNLSGITKERRARRLTRETVKSCFGLIFNFKLGHFDNRRFLSGHF